MYLSVIRMFALLSIFGFILTGCDFFKGSISRTSRISRSRSCVLDQSSTVVDSFQRNAGYPSVAWTIAQDKNGVMYIVGETGDAVNTYGAEIIVRRSIDFGETWADVLNYSYVPNGYTRMGSRIVFDSLNAAYLAITAQDLSSQYHYLLLKSSTGMTGSWSVIDDWQYNALTTGGPAVTDLVIDSSDNVYMQVTAYDGTNHRSILRKGAMSGTVWSVLDDYLHVDPASQTTYGSGVVVDEASGQLYILLTAKDAAYGGNDVSILRRSTDGGTIWTVADIYRHAGNDTLGYNLLKNSKGKIYIFMQASAPSRPVVRTGTGAGPYSTVLDYSYNGQTTYLDGYYIDSSDNVYVMYDTDPGPSGALTWSTQKSSDDGATWTLFDEYADPVYDYAYGFQMIKNFLGDFLFVGLSYPPPAAQPYWLVRRIKCR